MPHPLNTHQRQIHLDFHTAPFIDDVAADFDAVSFAETMRDAQVNSVTVFAKCHHGQSYYPTSVGVMHPALNGRDLLGEQIEALHRVGIRAPIYTTIAWEEHIAHVHPEWRQMRRDGSFAQVGRHAPTEPAGQAPWMFNNFLHPDYQDHIEAQLRELCGRYKVDGFFLDIVFFAPDSCWSRESVRFREQQGLLGTDAATQTRFESTAQASFAKRFTSLIHELKPQATVFYNSNNPICGDQRYGVRSRHAAQTHWELESLPSGFWGYHHFPRLARAFGAWGKPWLGMTGRFQRMWGDFGGLKPQAALEFECFRSQALGGANSVGDQLPPRGRLDAGAYDLIGEVYAQCARAESFYAGSTSVPQVGIIAPGSPNLLSADTDLALEGAVRLCEEAHYDAVVLDDASDFSGLDLIILADNADPTPELIRRLAAWRAAGGKVLSSHLAGFAADGSTVVPGIPLRCTGQVAGPTYWRADPTFDQSLSRSDRVCYLGGVKVMSTAGTTTEMLVQRVLPYAPRNELEFCSHFQTPPRATAEAVGAVVAGKDWVHFSDPIYREYRRSANTAVGTAWRAAMRRLIGGPPCGDGLPSTILCVPRRKGTDLLITLLHYIPTRKSLDIDSIDEPSSFGGDYLHLSRSVGKVRIHGGLDLVRAADGRFELPITKGRLLLEVPGWFA